MGQRFDIWETFWGYWEIYSTDINWLPCLKPFQARKDKTDTVEPLGSGERQIHKKSETNEGTCRVSSF